MRKKRGFFTLLLLLGLSGVTAYGVSRKMGFFLPSPKSCTHAQLFTWLTLRDLTQEPVELNLALIDRLQDELNGNLELAQSNHSIPEIYRERLHGNIDFLQQFWFSSRVREYSTLAANQRNEYLDEQIAMIVAWSNVENNLHEGTTGDREHSSAVFFDRISNWIDSAASAEQEQMNLAVHDGLIRWLETQDLNDESLETRSDLAKRITSRLEQGLRIEGVKGSSPQENQRLMANSILLVEAWFYDCVDEYCDLPKEKQQKYIDRKIDSISRWGIIDYLTKDRQDEPVSKVSSWFSFMGMVNQWIQKAEIDNRTRMQDFVNAVQKRILVFGLRRQSR